DGAPLGQLADDVADVALAASAHPAVLDERGVEPMEKDDQGTRTLGGERGRRQMRAPEPSPLGVADVATVPGVVDGRGRCPTGANDRGGRDGPERPGEVTTAELHG